MMDESECRGLRGFRKENAGCGADRQKCGTDAGSVAKQCKTATISIGAGSATSNRRHGVVLRRPAKNPRFIGVSQWHAAPITAVLHHCAVKFVGGDVGTRTTEGK
jgi:hypothetical protein